MGFPGTPYNGGQSLDTDSGAKTATAFLDAFKTSYAAAAAHKEAQKKAAEDAQNQQVRGQIATAIQNGDYRTAAALTAKIGAKPDDLLKHAGEQPKRDAEIDDLHAADVAPLARAWVNAPTPEARTQLIRMNRGELLKRYPPETVDWIENNPNDPAVIQTVESYANHGLTEEQRRTTETNRMGVETQRFQATHQASEGQAGHWDENGNWVLDYRKPSSSEYMADPGYYAGGAGGPVTQTAPAPEGATAPAAGAAPSGDAYENAVLRRETPNQSDYRPDGKLWRSPKGAMGRMQVMEATARKPGYGVRPWDGKSTEDLARVGRDYLVAMRREFNDDPAKVLAAYNAGPGRVKGLVARYGDNWLAHAPKETRDYVAAGLADMRAGGGSAPAGGNAPVENGPSMVSNAVPTSGGQGVQFYRKQPKPQEQWVTETLPDGTRIQRETTTGKERKVSGAPKQGGAAGKPLPTKVAETYSKKVGHYQGYAELNRTFRDEYAGIGSGIENTVQGYVNVGTPGQRDFWAGQKAIDNEIRNGLFGASLTEGEKKAFLETTVTPDMRPEEIRRNLSRRQAILEGALGREQRANVAAGYNKDQIKELSGGRVFKGGQLDGSGGGQRSSGGVRRVRSIEEARALPKGTRFIDPNGVERVR